MSKYRKLTGTTERLKNIKLRYTGEELEYPLMKKKTVKNGGYGTTRITKIN